MHSRLALASKKACVCLGLGCLMVTYQPDTSQALMWPWGQAWQTETEEPTQALAMLTLP